MPLLGRQKGYLKAAKHLEARERWDRPNSQSGLASNHLAAAIHNIRFPYRTSFRLAYCEGREKERGKKRRKGKERKRRRVFTVVISLLQPINSSGNFRGRCTFLFFYTYFHHLLLPSNSLRFLFHSFCLAIFLAFLFVLFSFLFFPYFFHFFQGEEDIGIIIHTVFIYMFSFL